MNIDFDMGTGRNELVWKISHDEESNELIAEIKKYGDVNYVDKKGIDYLGYATMHHKVKIIEVLLKKGANPNGSDENPGTILYALGKKNNNNPRILKIFLKYGMNLDIIVNGMTLRETIYAFDFNYDTPLYRPIIEEFEATH